MSADSDHDILLRVARGEAADRSPVWLMRQVGSLFGTVQKRGVQQ